MGCHMSPESVDYHNFSIQTDLLYQSQCGHHHQKRLCVDHCLSFFSKQIDLGFFLFGEAIDHYNLSSAAFSCLCVPQAKVTA